MIISRLKLKNWRNFRSVDVTLGRRAFLVGPNASGKSNFLDAIRFLRDIATPEGGGLRRALANRGGISKIRCLAARKDPEIEIEVDLTSDQGEEPVWRYAIGLKQEVRGFRDPYLSYERVWKNGKAIISRPDKDDLEDEARLTQTHLEQISANSTFREVSRFLASVSYLHLVPQLLRHPENFYPPSVKEDPFGRNFLERVRKTRKSTQGSRLRRIGKALRIAVPQLKQLALNTDESGVPHLEAIYEHWRAKGAKQSEEEFSDGTLRLIGLLWALLDGESPLLLEEPELSLHSAVISKIPGLMARLSNKKKRQLIISTHSPDLLSDKGIGGEEVLLLIPDAEGTEVSLASSKAEIKALLESGFSVGEVAIPTTEPKNIHQLTLFDL